MTAIDGRLAVVTGAGSGIGRALCYTLARRGARLAISDVNAAGLAETASHARLIGVRVDSAALDVTDRAAVLAYADRIAAEHGSVNIVINNAGIAFTGDIEAMAFSDIERVMDVDFWGVVNGTKAFLPHVIASGEGHIVNISSLFGLMAVPGQGAYNAAKFAVRGFTEALRQEMQLAGHPVQVTSVHPGGVKTSIARNAAAVADQDPDRLAQVFDQRLARTSADAAARTIVRGIRGNRARVLVGTDAKALDLLVRLTGAGYQRFVTAGARRLAAAAAAPAQSQSVPLDTVRR